MKYRSLIVRVGISINLLCMAALAVNHVQADTPPTPAVFIREIKITGDEFVVLQANQTVNLGDYWLGYSSSDTATTIVPTQQLPAQTLAAGQAILLTSDGSTTCDAVLITKLSASLSDTKGTLVVRQLQSSGASSTFTTVDSVNWSKPGTSSTTTDDLDLRKETSSMASPVWYHGAPGNAWQVGDFSGCTLTFAATSGVPITSVSWPQNDSDPPATIESLAADDTAVSGPVLPAGDVGLLPPQLTELLPNPDGTGTDGTDEFIELYNPNGAVFDLSGFILQTGLTTKHSYTFPAGAVLPPKGFVAFYSSTTGLSLSNTSGQADLEDPFGTVIAQTDAYDTAKDGMSWALAKGTWYWTSKPTPNAANAINQTTIAPKTTAKITTTKANVGSVKGASTTTGSGAGTSSASDTADAPSAPIHPLVLAAVAALAVGYGVYEYRRDLANRLHQFRTNRAARRAARG